ncbi:extracellular solute-binding protein [Acidisoma cladoniae]|jgi:multiple sugar transport system substrate-binding protein|uniref:extracellular solute-binding protein n=1 Tax=Acidisoma cladoniae TaxID=3040935 RepID=UPI00254E346D|nr:extracellular solute-binding protein [Acidisoma sp. PAMC 29798]
MSDYKASGSAALGRRGLLKGASTLGATALLTAPYIARAQDNMLRGKSIHMSILGIAGWTPSRLGVDMAPGFVTYAKEKFGYDVTFSYAEAPFSQLFQKAATSLATRSQEYNIIISDSQWLGALAQPKWILPLDKVIAQRKTLDVEWFSPVVRDAYQAYPDGSKHRWGFPQEGDCMGLYIRKDLLEAPGEAEAFEKRYGRKLPMTWDDFEALSYADFLKVIEFFNRPEKGYNGFGSQFSREYDFISDPVMSLMRSTGGDIWDPKTGQVEGILNTPGNAKALQMYKDLLQFEPAGAISYGVAELIDAFTQGKVFSALQWCAVGPAMITKELEGKVMVVPPPGFPDASGKLVRNYIIGGQPWVLNAFNDAEHQAVALDFMEWWYTPETCLAYAKHGGNPCDKVTLTRPDFESIQPWYKTYKYMLNNSSDFWHDPAYADMLSVQQEAFTAFATGQVKDPLQALNYTACRQQKILFDAGTATTQASNACDGIRL